MLFSCSALLTVTTCAPCFYRRAWGSPTGAFPSRKLASQRSAAISEPRSSSTEVTIRGTPGERSTLAEDTLPAPPDNNFPERWPMEPKSLVAAAVGTRRASTQLAPLFHALRALGGRRPHRDAPPDPRQEAFGSQLAEFTRALAASRHQRFDSYDELHAFSVGQFRTFWRFFLQWCREPLGLAGEDEPVCVGDSCETAQFFPALLLNYADSLLNLSVAPANATAL